jgi:hypothetical protein
MDPQVQQRMMLYAGLIPGAISFLLMLAAWYLHALRTSKTDLDDSEDTQPVSQGPRWMLPVMLALGVAGADYATNYGVKLWPDDNTYRYIHAILLLALAGVAEGLVRMPVLVAALTRTLAYAGVFWMLTEGYAQTIMGGSANLIAYTLFAALCTATIATAADRSAEHNNHKNGLGWVDAITWAAIAGAIMPVLLANHFAIGAMLPGGIISVLVSTIMVGLIFRNLSIARGGITVLCGFVMMMIAGSLVQTGADNLPSVLLVASLPLVTLIPQRSHSAIKRLIMRFVFFGAIAGAAMATIHAPSLSFWPGNADDQGQSEQDQSLEDYYNNLE